MWYRTLKLGIRNLLLHKLRSMLTMLGTILGVGSVISMLAIGEGSKRHAVEQIRQLGAANVIIRSVKPQSENTAETSSASATQVQASRVLEYGLKYRDYDRLVAALPTVKTAVPIAMIRKNAQHGRYRITNARILGSTPALQTIKRFSVLQGRFLEPADLERTAAVCVLGASAAERLFSFEDPLDKVILLGDGAYRVIGVLSHHDSGTAKTGTIGLTDFNQDIYIPLSSIRSRFGELQMIVRAGSREFERNELAEITLAVHDETQVSVTASMARKLLQRPAGDRLDFEVQVPLELLQQAEREKRIWNIVLGSIAGISLLVGGIGIMNIMLATVTERTREIGIRRALGARRIDIVIQFLAETVVLSTTGGLIGIGVGVGIPFFVTAVADIQTAVSWWSIAIAFAISVGTGIVFGVYPARRAARLDPIEALRYQG